MIRIERGIEAEHCHELSEIRRKELARIQAELDRGTPLNEHILGREYRMARPSLYAMQGGKCCYCEDKQNSERWRDIEHFRPKLSAHRADGSVDVGYWWLTWSWNNLLFACPECNNAKRSKFPLAEGSMPLSPGEEPPGREIALLIDPCTEDPREHLRFRPLGNRWIPVYRTARGKEMLEALGWLVEPDSFKQDGLVDKWQWHVEGMRELLAALGSAFDKRDPLEIAVIWGRTGRFRRLGSPFVALSLDVLEHHFGEEIQHYQLDMSILRR